MGMSRPLSMDQAEAFLRQQATPWGIVNLPRKMNPATRGPAPAGLFSEYGGNRLSGVMDVA